VEGEAEQTLREISMKKTDLKDPKWVKDAGPPTRTAK